MKTISLYRYTRPDGGVTVSPVKPDTEYTELFRLVAEDGMALSNGTDTAGCVDTDDPAAWSEVESTDAKPADEATAEDYQSALTEFGVKL